MNWLDITPILEKLANMPFEKLIVLAFLFGFWQVIGLCKRWLELHYETRNASPEPKESTAPEKPPPLSDHQ